VLGKSRYISVITQGSGGKLQLDGSVGMLRGPHLVILNKSSIF